MRRRVEFRALDWEDDGPGIRAEHVAGSRWPLAEYRSAHAREEWCTDGHRGCVIEGALQYVFDDGSEPLLLRAGEGTGHRGRNVTDALARIFLIDDALS